ncbi:MAG: hypothetical protein ABL985_06935 [Casimicrobium sp.]
MTLFPIVLRHDFPTHLSFSRRRGVCALALAVLSATFAAHEVAAQPTPPAATTPTQPVGAGATPTLHYSSAFARYRPWTEVGIKPWRANNDTVEQRGGWRAYLKESQASDAADVVPPASAAASPAPARPAAPSPHSGHGAKP